MLILVRGRPRAGAQTSSKAIGWNSRPGRTCRPSRRARNGAEARTCRAMPRHSVVERSRIAFSVKIFLETAPVEAANSASSWRSANAGGPTRPYVWDRGPKWHMPVPVRPYLSRFNASLASEDTPVPQAAAATEEDASGCVTHTSTTGRPGRYRRRSPRCGSRWERGGSYAGGAAGVGGGCSAGGCGGIGRGGRGYGGHCGGHGHAGRSSGSNCHVSSCGTATTHSSWA